MVAIFPPLGVLGLLGLYSLYVLYVGATPMMGVPQDKAAGYVVITIVAAIIVYFVIGAVAAAFTPTMGPTITLT